LSSGGKFVTRGFQTFATKSAKSRPEQVQQTEQKIGNAGCAIVTGQKGLFRK
jgi:hypothetical protein